MTQDWQNPEPFVLSEEKQAEYARRANDPAYNTGMGTRHDIHRSPAEKIAYFNGRMDDFLAEHNPGWRRVGSYIRGSAQRYKVPASDGRVDVRYGPQPHIEFRCPQNHEVLITPKAFFDRVKQTCTECQKNAKASQWNIIARQRGYEVQIPGRAVTETNYVCGTCGEIYPRQRKDFLSWQKCPGCDTGADTIHDENDDIFIAYDDHDCAVIYMGRMPQFVYMAVQNDGVNVSNATEHDVQSFTSDEAAMLRRKPRGPKTALIERIASLWADDNWSVLNTEDNPAFKEWNEDGTPSYTFDINDNSPLTRAVLGMEDG